MDALPVDFWRQVLFTFGPTVLLAIFFAVSQAWQNRYLITRHIPAMIAAHSRQSQEIAAAHSDEVVKLGASLQEGVSRLAKAWQDDHKEFRADRKAERDDFLRALEVAHRNHLEQQVRHEQFTMRFVEAVSKDLDALTHKIDANTAQTQELVKVVWAQAEEHKKLVVAVGKIGESVERHLNARMP